MKSKKDFWLCIFAIFFLAYCGLMYTATVSSNAEREIRELNNRISRLEHFVDVGEAQE